MLLINWNSSYILQNMGDCNKRRVFFVIVVTLFKISIFKYSELTGDKILKFCPGHHTVFPHRFVPIWIPKALFKPPFWSVTTYNSFWADITLTLVWMFENIFGRVGGSQKQSIWLLRCLIFFHTEMNMLTRTFKFLMRDDNDI